MRTVLAALLTAGLVAVAGAQDPPKLKKVDTTKRVDDEPKKEAKSLKIGDPAPPLKADKWLQGTEVTEFAPGKVYVVEFWATWCGPCIVMMPHMAELQQEYRNKGVTIIGFTRKDPNNSAEKVASFVEKRGPKLDYTFAYADDSETYDAWMKAAGQGGIPCSYVVDKGGKIAFIGHPMLLDDVLPKVVDGTWRGKEDADEVLKGMQEFSKAHQAMSGADVEAGLKALADLEANRPNVAKAPYLIAPRLNLLLKAEKYDEVKATAEGLMAKAVKQEDPTVLRTISTVLQSAAARDRKELAKLSVEAAEIGVKLAGDKDAVALLTLAQAYFAAGDVEKAKEVGRKAIDAADNDRMKTALERIVKEFDKEKGDEDKQ
jgi:thiol-disulfide isomerase/thioredoxin